MTGYEQARQALKDLTPQQLREVAMCFWVADPTLFFKAAEAAAT